MFKCAWCKNDTNVYEWSKEKEPLCSECAPKYNFGCARGMISEKVLDLSKEKRREVSERMGDYTAIRRVWRSVGREELAGKAKTLGSIVGWGIFALWFWVIGTLSTIALPDWFLFRGVAGGAFSFFASFVVPVALALPFAFLYKGIVWCIKFRQLIWR